MNETTINKRNKYNSTESLLNNAVAQQCEKTRLFPVAPTTKLGGAVAERECTSNGHDTQQTLVL